MVVEGKFEEKESESLSKFAAIVEGGERKFVFNNGGNECKIREIGFWKAAACFCFVLTF